MNVHRRMIAALLAIELLAAIRGVQYYRVNPRG